MSASSLPLPQGKSVSLKQFVSRHINEIGLLVVIAILYLVFSLNAPGFISLNNQMNVLRDAATIGIAAWAMTLIIISGEIDVSVGPMVAFVSVCLAFLLQFQVPLLVACLLVLLLGAVLGTLACLATLMLQPDIWGLLLTAAIIGGVANPVYSLLLAAISLVFIELIVHLGLAPGRVCRSHRGAGCAAAGDHRGDQTRSPLQRAASADAPPTGAPAASHRAGGHVGGRDDPYRGDQCLLPPWSRPLPRPAGTRCRRLHAG